jgi:phosphatidylinositol glycan class C protein
MLQLSSNGVSAPKTKQLSDSTAFTDDAGSFPLTTASLKQRNSNSKSNSNGAVVHSRARHSFDPDRLAPEDAFYAHSPPRTKTSSRSSPVTTAIDTRSVKESLQKALPRDVNGLAPRCRRDKERGRSGSRRYRPWKKLLWVNQPYPDNYTDEETFLDHLQRNPRLQPYDFWPLVADSTVIVQHVCSVIIFVCCFVGIFQERVSPVTVVSWASFGTVIGWVLWDCWVGQEEASQSALAELSTGMDTMAVDGGLQAAGADDPLSASSTTSSFNIGPSHHHKEDQGLTMALPSLTTSGPRLSYTPSATSMQSNSSLPSPVLTGHPTGASSFASYSYYPPYGAPASSISPRNQQRLATAKSAVLIYCALLGLSPILKSLTKSTTSDSIWAMSCWLMCINVFFFDYGGGMEIKYAD